MKLRSELLRRDTPAQHTSVLRLLRQALATACLIVVATVAAHAQMSGSYTVGAGGTYTTIDAAIAALTSGAGVNGPVVFLIANGTYTPPANGWVLPAVSGMSATNTVTFRPTSGATVTISGTTNDGTAIFAIDGGDYYIIDGSNTAGGATRDMTIRQTSTAYAAAVWVRNDADFNIVKNTIMQSANGTGGVNVALGGVTVFVGQSTGSSGNDSTLIQNNQVGDVNGSYRAFRAVYIYGQSPTMTNIGTRVIDNDVVNFGNVQSAAYGIFVSYHNTGTIVRGNSVRMTTTSSTTFTSVFALYCNEQYISSTNQGNTAHTVFERNRIYDLQTSNSSESIYGLAYYGDNNTNSSAVRVVNNMFALDRGSNYTTWYGIQISETNTSGSVSLYYNSMYLGGSGNYAYMLYANIGGSGALYHYNNAYYSTWTSSGYGLYLASNSGWNSNNNLIQFNLTSGGAYTAYFNGPQTTLDNYKTAVSTQESASVSGNPQWISPSTCNLHVNPIPASAVESRGRVIASVTTDFDGEARNASTPDIGADEGNFNAGGIAIEEPDGGEQYLGGSTITIEFTASRPLNVRVEFSSNNGATWSSIATSMNVSAGTSTLDFTTPDIATSVARIRVMSNSNAYEGDTSGAFRLLQPALSLISPNGGETYYQGDIAPITWSSTDIPVGSLVELAYSTDAGATWQVMATDLVSLNLPSTNTYYWSIPAIRTSLALVRVRMLDKDVSDVSNATFTILKSMNLLSPNGGEIWIPGEKEYVSWSVNRVNRINVDLSTDGGATWTSLKAGIRATYDSVEIVVPNTPTTQALIRIVNADAPEFTEQSAAVFTIVPWAVQVLSPNGGEKYELNQPVTVSWHATINGMLKLEYTSDGVHWDPIASGISANLGGYSFTPPAFPTKLARVRVSFEDRPHLTDASDAPFEIMEAPGIAVFSPSANEELMRGSTYEIHWQANRIAFVNVEYSPTGTAPWTRLASNVPAGQGTFLWTVPGPLTRSGKIRVLQVGGSIIGESGLFAVVDPVASVRLIRPNGGEVYTVGDEIRIAWTASLVPTVTLQYTSDGGASWRPITGAESLPAAQGSFMWTASAPGIGYRVRVMSGALFDDSDNNFTIKRAPAPGITVLSPNGGESYRVDSTITVLWTALDITGDVAIELSRDSGATWTTLGTAAFDAGTFDWRVDSVVTENALVRVTNGVVADQSDAVFSIFIPLVRELTVLTPNNNEVMWTEGDNVDIEWTSANVDFVDIFLSNDGGATWGPAILTNVPAASGRAGYRVPHLLDTASDNMMLKIAESTTGFPSDISDETFAYRPATASTGADAMARGLQLFGTYPNPFTSQAEIRWSQPVGGNARLTIVDAAGNVVDRSELGYRDAGSHAALIEAASLSSGTYRYELRIGTATLRGSMTITR